MFVMSYTVPSAVHACKRVQAVSDSYNAEVVKQQGRLPLTKCSVQPCILQGVQCHESAMAVEHTEMCRFAGSAVHNFVGCMLSAPLWQHATVHTGTDVHAFFTCGK